jgi:hypothetical protein
MFEKPGRSWFAPTPGSKGRILYEGDQLTELISCYSSGGWGRSAKTNRNAVERQIHAPLTNKRTCMDNRPFQKPQGTSHK